MPVCAHVSIDEPCLLTFFIIVTVRQSRVGMNHKVTKEDAIKWFQDKFEGVVLAKAL